MLSSTQTQPTSKATTCSATTCSYSARCESESTNEEADVKYILVTGGVISGIGKGVITSSIGMLLKSIELNVTAIKIDPYLNIDAGTFSPYEHGEVFVLDDGSEVDLDLGNYERFLDVTLTGENNITTGKIYQHVIDKERKGDYLGKTVQVVPHITDAIQEWVERVAKIPVDGKKLPRVCLIELGGTVGDIEGMPFIEAFREFQFKVGVQNFCNVHVSLVPQLSSTSEQKTKPTQNSVRELRKFGLTPDMIVCRSQNRIDDSVTRKISSNCYLKPEQVVAVHDCPSIYQVPLLLEEQKVLKFLVKRLELRCERVRTPTTLLKWLNLADQCDSQSEEVEIVLVGKYTKLKDSYISVIKALKHAAVLCRRKLQLTYVEASDLEEEERVTNPTRFHEAWRVLSQADGVLVPGGFGIRGIEGMISAANHARERKIPYLGVCLGMQTAVIEFARNVIGWKDANSTEFNAFTSQPVVIEMPEHHPGKMGGTMRLGKRKTIFKKGKNSVLKKLYLNEDFIEERHRHRYEVNFNMVESFEKEGLTFVAHDEEGKRMEIVELADHPYFVGVQYHPEYLTRPMTPSPPYLGLVLAAIGRL